MALPNIVADLTLGRLTRNRFALNPFEGLVKGAIFVLYLATLIIPHQLLLVPRFILYRELGIYDTLWALILPGVTIGARAVIGAGSVVTKDVPAGVLAVGNPCRVVRNL